MKKILLVVAVMLLIVGFVAWQQDLQQSYKDSSSVLVTEIDLMKKEVKNLLREKKKLESSRGSSFEADMRAASKISIINKRGKYLLKKIIEKREALIGMRVAMQSHSFSKLVEGKIVSDPKRLETIENNLMPWKVKNPWR